MLLLNILKELLLVGTVINLSNAEIDLDAISQVRFVQYQPIVEKSRKFVSDDVSKQKELNAAETGYYSNSLEKPNIQRNSEGDAENLSVPKNYAFSYAIKDRNSGDDFSHTQAHNGQATKGEYRVTLPDGRRQVVTYKADNDGYKADIRYDNDAAQESSNNGLYVTKGFSDDFSLPSKHSKQNLNFDKNSFDFAKEPKQSINFDKNSFDFAKESKQNLNFDKNSFDFDSLRENPSFFRANEFKNFNFPSSTRKPASYETTENIDEELFPYSKKLLDDVNYLLKYVTPTIESNNRGKEKISIDFTKGRFLNDDPHFKNKFKDEPAPKDKFHLPANFPYQFTKFEEPKFEKLSFNEPNYDDHTFIEPSLMGPNKEEDKFRRLKYQSTKQEPQITKQIFSGSQFEELRSNFPSSNEKYFDNVKFNNQKFDGQPIQRTNLQNDNPKLNDAGSKDQQFEKSHFHKLRNDKDPQFENSNFHNLRNNEPPKQEQIKFESSDSNNLKFNENVKFDDNSKFNELRPNNKQIPEKIIQQTPNFEQEAYEVPKFDPKLFENAHFEQSNYETPNYNTFSNSNDPKFNNPANNDGNPKQNSLEIPQYIHIHRYEASGEDQTHNSRPKELIYYNPLQIPVPNSIAYVEQGSYNFSNPQHSTLTPSYITMTEHPRAKPTDTPPHYHDHTNLPLPEFSLQLNGFDQSKENYLRPTPQTPETPVLSISPKTPENYENRPTYNYDATQLNSPPAPLASPVTPDPEPPLEEHNNYENTIGGLPPYFDPRTYSGYFDFLPTSGETESEREKESPPEINNYPSTPDHAETPKNELPQYYYDFSTATPSHKYVSSAEVASREEFQPVLDPDQIRNTSSFLASAYLRPLHKERVYIYHNSLPTVSAEENHNFSPTTPFEPKTNKNDADIQIVKSISSTIPPELLKDFDRQLSSPIFTRSDDNSDANSEPKQVKVSSESPPRLRSDIVKQLQSALATNSIPYLKTPTHQKRISR